MPVKPIPDNTSTVTPYLVVADAVQLIEFLTKAFGASIVHRTTMPDGTVMHAHLRIGDSSIMLGQMPPDRVMPATMLYMYVTDVDAVFRQSVEAGATVVHPLVDQFYGDRTGAVKDPAGNQWWIATHKEDISNEELAKRAAAAAREVTNRADFRSALYNSDVPDPARFAIASVPTGSWAVGVSGGADSVALLLLLHERADLKLHVVHLDHQTRGDESTADAAFVKALAHRLGIPSTIALLSDVEAATGELEANTSARYRAARIALFRRVVAENALAGVILAHHADDQTETVLHRLLRGSGPMGLAAMDRSSDLGGLLVVRPLLEVTREQLRVFLKSIDQDWREDASNESDDYFRNRLRRWLGASPSIAADLLELGISCNAMRRWTRETAPRLDSSFAVDVVARLPTVLAAESARRWLIENRVPAGKISPAVIDQLLKMASDGASSPAPIFPAIHWCGDEKG